MMTYDHEITCNANLDCGVGNYVRNDCICSPPDDPCSACPQGTICQLSPTLKCTDCACGFCNHEAEPCCTFNDQNNYRSATNDNECLL
eukprot:620828-Ditylum_brightwellii.AAC.1